MQKTPPIFNTIKKEVLGKKYELSVAFLSPQEMRRITRKTKKRNVISNVLAFPLSNKSGEILICKQAAWPYTYTYLFIHAILHLKGHKHGATMECEEKRLMRRFRIRKNA